MIIIVRGNFTGALLPYRLSAEHAHHPEERSANANMTAKTAISSQLMGKIGPKDTDQLIGVFIACQERSSLADGQVGDLKIVRGGLDNLGRNC